MPRKKKKKGHHRNEDFSSRENIRKFNKVFKQHYSEELEERMRKHVFGLLRTWSAEREIQRAHWYMARMLYNGYAPDKRYVRTHGANVWVPEPYMLARTIAPRIVAGSFGAKRWYGLNSAAEGTTREHVASMGDLVDWMKVKCDWEAVLMQTALNAVIDGVAVNFWEWDVTDHQTITYIGKPEQESEENPLADPSIVEAHLETTTSQELRLRMVDAAGYFQDLSCINPQDPPPDFAGAAVPEDVTWDMVRQRIEDGYYNKHASRILDTLSRSTGRDEPGQPLGSHRGSASELVTDWDDSFWEAGYEEAETMAAGKSPYAWLPFGDSTDTPRKWKAKKFQGPAPLEIDSYGMPRMVWCEVEFIGPFMVRCTENTNPLQKSRFVTMQVEPRPDGYNAHGVIQPCAGLLRELNEIEGMTLDVGVLDIQGMYLVEHRAGIPGNRIQHTPGGIVLCNSINAVKALDPPKGLRDGIAIKGMIRDDIRQSSGLPPVTMGQSATTRDTGVATTAYQEEANFRFRFSINWIQKTHTRPLMQHAVAMIQTHMARAEMARVQGPRGYQIKEISPKDIAGQYDITVLDASQLSDDALGIAQAQNYVKMVTEASMSPLGQALGQPGVGPDIVKLVRRIGELQRIPGLADWWPETREALKLSTFQILLHYANGGELSINPNDDHLGFFVTMTTPPQQDPNDPDPKPQIPPIVAFMTNEDIPPVNRKRFEAYFTNRANLAQKQVELIKSQQMQQMIGQPPGAEGMPPPGVEPPSEGTTGQTPSQEMPRSEENPAGTNLENTMRMGAQMPTSSVHKTPFGGMK